VSACRTPSRVTGKFKSRFTWPNLNIRRDGPGARAASLDGLLCCLRLQVSDPASLTEAARSAGPGPGGSGCKTVAAAQAAAQPAACSVSASDSYSEAAGVDESVTVTAGVMALAPAG